MMWGCWALCFQLMICCNLWHTLGKVLQSGGRGGRGTRGAGLPEQKSCFHLLTLAPSSMNLKLAAFHGQLSKAALHCSFQLLASCLPLYAQLRGSFTQLLMLGCNLPMQLFLSTCKIYITIPLSEMSISVLA